MWASECTWASRRRAVPATIVLLVTATLQGLAQQAAAQASQGHAAPTAAQRSPGPPTPPVAPGDATAPAAPTITDVDIARASRQHRLPPSLQGDKLPVPATPRIDALPRPAGPTITPDLAELARGFEAAIAKQASQALDGGPQLLVFVSASMPNATWQRLLNQAEQARATLVLRGLIDGSLRQTVLRMQQLIGSRRVAVQIDPQAFIHHGVEVVPSFVLLHSEAGADATGGCAGAACPHPAATRPPLVVAGDVSLDYALRQFAAHSPAAARDAGVFLHRLTGGAR